LKNRADHNYEQSTPRPMGLFNQGSFTAGWKSIIGVAIFVATLSDMITPDAAIPAPIAVIRSPAIDAASPLRDSRFIRTPIGSGATVIAAKIPRLKLSSRRLWQRQSILRQSR
jgi:hypothetical protein